MTAVAAPEPPAELHAPWCSGGCPRWLGSGRPTCLPTPCVCAVTRRSAEERGLPGRCWWINRVTLKATSRCPCWGSPRDGRPGDCCGHHSANPYYLRILTALDDPDDAEIVKGAVGEADPGATADDQAPPEFEPAWEDVYDFPERILKPYVRRWAAEEITCPCRTPWDRPPGDTRKVDPRTLGHHCPADGCHTNWASFSASTTHRPDWTEPCRPPETIVDCDTGEALLRARDVAGFTVWGW
jgi:hypothetical protein